MFATGALQAREPAPLSAYGALPDVEDAAISPSGANIVFLATIDGQRQLVFLGPDRNVIDRTGVGDAKIRYFDWIGDDRLLLVLSQTQDVYGFTVDKLEIASARIITVGSDGGVETVFSDDRRLLDAVFGSHGVRRVGGHWVAYFGALELKRDSTGPGYVFDHGRPFLYAFDIDATKSTRVANAPGEDTSRDWLVDRDGKVATTFDIDSDNGRWEIRNADNKRIAEGRDEAGRAGLIGLGHDGTSVIYYQRDEEGGTDWFEVPLAGGTALPFLAEADVDRLYFDELSGRLIGYLDAKEGPVFADKEQQDAARKIRRAFAKLDMQMVDWTPELDKVLVRSSGNADSGSYYVVDLTTMRGQVFAWERLAIEPDMVGPISTFQYTAADGLEMDGILTLPPEREAKALPLVMLPHGGPHSADREQFDWWAQAFASRGFAVFQPNFRGSTNRDQTFKIAGYGEWGRKMQTDISDGLRALAESGIVDPNRACIVGASYGGYAALAGVTLQQGLYRCAVAVAPVSDIKAMYNEEDRAADGRKITRASLLTQLGPRDGWDSVSPRRFADRADAPIMLIHGREDTVVPFLHSHKMADALKDAGKPYELVALDGEDHWLSLSTTRLQMLEAAVGFVQKHNPAD
ncbi:alpha/beta hydrolase family protein [Alteriqipengyuania lutimaris]|uniref:S9 family peptidase n=1 Tax=Alteriqipengyuania lutimaris TaxID=1538146 RepID=A0A395LGV5_9SPHN|nr:alpha/beta fold hydrolase [Alteriqipengyuania lutimaris]MBB3035237.1 dipeptidyl aminopeptidase/acylaminoacyl peptidase [Alteriqipengyuania lutimaris]RDS76126.1 S9 family peptidase [Alteriqipengyuania lutimaris]